MHIRRGFSVRLVGQSLKRIGTALKDMSAGHHDRFDTTDLPADLHALGEPDQT